MNAARAVYFAWFPTEIPYSQLPEDHQLSMKRWIEHGLEPGSFLQAALKNSFVDAICHAHPVTMARLKDIAIFLANYVPTEAWGSPAKFQAWKERGGLLGR